MARSPSPPSGRTGTRPESFPPSSSPWRSLPGTARTCRAATATVPPAALTGRGAAELTTDENRPPPRRGNTRPGAVLLEPTPRERDPIGLLHSTGYSVTSSRTGSRNRPGTEEHTDEYPGAGRASPRSTRRHRPIREGHGPRRPGPDRPARGGAGDPRAEWRRQDHVRPDNRHPPAANERRVARAGKRCRGRPGERPPGHRPGRSVRRGRAHDDRAREPRNDGPAVRAPEKRVAAGGVDRGSGTDRGSGRGPALQHLLRRSAPQTRSGGQPGRRAAAPAARRADGPPGSDRPT